jgi:hypothetical protein
LGWWGRQIVCCLADSRKFKLLYGVEPNPRADLAAFARGFGLTIEADLGAVLRNWEVEGFILATCRFQKLRFARSADAIRPGLYVRRCLRGARSSACPVHAFQAKNEDVICSP